MNLIVYVLAVPAFHRTFNKRKFKYKFEPRAIAHKFTIGKACTNQMSTTLHRGYTPYTHFHKQFISQKISLCRTNQHHHLTLVKK